MARRLRRNNEIWRLGSIQDGPFILTRTNVNNQDRKQPMPFSDEDQDRASQWINYWNDIFGANPEAVTNADASFCPPDPSPDERSADEDPKFVANCRKDVISMAQGGPVVWEGQLLTRSPKWGLIWRADFWEPKMNNQGFPSRVTCWRNDNGESGTTISGLQHDKLVLKP